MSLVDVKFVNKGTRISIQMFFPGAYDYEEGYYEIAHIKLSNSKASFMDDMDLDEVEAILKLLRK